MTREQLLKKLAPVAEAEGMTVEALMSTICDLELEERAETAIIAYAEQEGIDVDGEDVETIKNRYLYAHSTESFDPALTGIVDDYWTNRGADEFEEAQNNLAALYEAQESAIKNYREAAKQFAQTCLEEAGMTELVRVKCNSPRHADKIGGLCIESDYYCGIQNPYVIRFYHRTKAGTLSQKSTYVCEVSTRDLREKDPLELLKRFYEPYTDEGETATT